MKEKDVLGICKRKALKIYIEECHVKKKDSEFAMAKIYYHAYLKGFVAGWKEVLEELKYEDCFVNPNEYITKNEYNIEKVDLGKITWGDIKPQVYGPMKYSDSDIVNKTKGSNYLDCETEDLRMTAEKRRIKGDYKWIKEWGARTKKDWLISGREPIDEENPIGFDRDYNPVWVRRETEKLVPVEQGPAPSVIAKRIFNYNERTKFEAKTEYEWGLIGFDILQNEIKNPIAWNECKQPLYVKIQTKEK